MYEKHHLIDSDYLYEDEVAAKYAPRDHKRYMRTRSYDNLRVEFSGLRTSSSSVEGFRKRRNRKVIARNRRRHIKNQ